MAHEGYKGFSIAFLDGKECEVEELYDLLSVYWKNMAFSLYAYDSKNQKYVIAFTSTGCEAWAMENQTEKKPVVSEEQKSYCFFGNKGYYRNIELFKTTVLSLWNETPLSDV